MELDQVDYRILAILQEDARIPLNKLARKARISVPTARQRIKRLLERDVIKQFTTLLNPAKMAGYYDVFIGISAKPSELERIASELAEQDDVVGVYRTVGENDLVIRVSVRSYSELDKFIVNKLSPLKGVQKINTSIVVSTVKDEPTPRLKPGMGIKTYCAVCGKEITDKPLRQVFNGKEYYLCCNSCLTFFEQRAILGKIP